MRRLKAFNPEWPISARRLVSVCLALSAFVLGAWQNAQQPASVVASRQADVVAVITIQGVIDSVTSYSVQRRLQQAADAGVGAVVIEIDSPGGELGAVLDISSAIKQTTIPITVAWINAQAYSGGAIVALACQEIITAQRAQMGDAFPITFINHQGGQFGLRGLTPDERTKLLPPLLADVVDSARRSGYDEYLVQAMVSDGVELWLVENKDTGQRYAINENEYRAVFGHEPERLKPIIPHVSGARHERAFAARPPADQAEPTADDATYKPAAPELGDLTQAVTTRLNTTSERPRFDQTQAGNWKDLGYLTDGSSAIVIGVDRLQALGFSSGIITNDEQLKAYFGAEQIVRLDQSWSESASRILTNMWVRYVLIAIFLLAIFIEMSSPGLVLPGAVALCAGFLLIAPPMIIGMANWWEVGAILLGVVFILLEIFVLPGFGIFGIVGLVALFAGMIGTFIPNGAGIVPTEPGAASAAIKGMVSILLAIVTAGIGMYFVTKHFGSLPLLNRLVLQDQPPDDDFTLTSIMNPRAAAAPPVAVGDVGLAITPLKPVGQAEINDQILDVIADTGFVDSGTRIRVLAHEPMRILVEPLTDEESQA